MKPVQLLLMMGVLLASAASGQLLDCPSSASRTTEPFHFHVQMYRPDTRGFLDVWGINDFASQSACDRAREAAMKRNLAVVDYFKRVRGENQYEPDRFGTCHADMSIDRTNPRYLSDPQRTAQVREAEDVRQRVREQLLHAGLTTDSEVFRDVGLPVSAPSTLISGPRLVPIPQSAVVQTALLTVRPEDDPGHRNGQASHRQSRSAAGRRRFRRRGRAGRDSDCGERPRFKRLPRFPLSPSQKRRRP